MIGENVRKIREFKGLSRENFGRRIFVSGDVINNLERERAKPNELLIDSICKEYSVNREWLETGVGEMFIKSPESALDRLAAEHNLGPNQKALLSVAMEALDTLDDAACEILIDRLFAKIMEIKDEQNRKAAASVSISSDESTDGEITNPQAAAK